MAAPLRRLALAPLGLFVPLLRPEPAPGEGLPARRARSGASTVRAALRTSVAEGMLAEVFTACTSNAMLTAWDPLGEKLAERRVPPNFKLSSTSADKWVAGGFGAV